MKKSRQKTKTPQYQRELPLPDNALLMTLRMTMICFLPLALFFSYRPVFSFGASESMNFELSIAEIYLVIFALLSLFDRGNLRMFFSYYGKRLIPFALFPLFASLSIIWSPNHLRAFLTAGLLWVVIFDALQAHLIIHNTPFLQVSFRRHLLRAAVFVSIICWLQCFLDVFGVSSGFTGLCRGCTYYAFGFPHPNGFAIEPQFMGNLLLAPTFIAIYSLIFEPDRPHFVKKSTHVIIALFLTATLFLTFSRGAIYSFLLGLAVIFLLQFPIIKYSRIKSKKTTTTNFNLTVNSKALWLVPITLAGFLIALTAQGLFAQLSPTNDTFFTGVAKSVHQLSLGKIDFRPAEAPTSAEPTTTFAEIEAAEEITDSVYTGYVEQSTAFRTELTNTALDIWDDSKTNLLFGTGLGSAGTKLLEKNPDFGNTKEIVQNEYASVLLELGLVGALLVVVMFVATLTLGNLVNPAARATDFFKNPLLVGGVVAFAASLFFFAGLPNALHVYLFPLFLAQPAIERAGRHK